MGVSILAEHDPYINKGQGKGVKNTTQWDREKDKILRDITLAKFTQPRRGSRIFFAGGGGGGNDGCVQGGLGLINISYIGTQRP